MVDFIEIYENRDASDQLDWRANREFSRSAHHCSLEAILGRTKLSKKTKIGDAISQTE